MSTATPAVSATPRTPVLGVARRRRGEDAIRAPLFLAALLSILTTLGIVFSLLRETLAFFGEVGIVDFLTGTEWSPLFSDPAFGVLPLVTGTLLVSALSLIVAIPLGLGTRSTWPSTPSPRRAGSSSLSSSCSRACRTIVFGYFALTFFTPVVYDDLLGMDVRTFDALSAGIIMGFMVLPTVASTSEDAMSAVSRALREGAIGLGANKLQVSLFVVFPAALSGIVAAIVLGVSRAIGETMIVLVAAGQRPNLTADPRQSVETITTFIAATARGACRPASTAPEARQARGEPRVAPLCAGTAVGHGCSGPTVSPAVALTCSGSVGVTVAGGPSLGAVVEPGANLQPVAPGLPR